MDDRELLALQAKTNFVVSAAGRIVRTSSPDRGAGPRLYLSGCGSGNVVRLHEDVGAANAEAIERLGASEPPMGVRERAPVHRDQYVRLLEAEMHVERCEPGLIWSFPDSLEYDHPAPIVRSGTPEGDRLVGRIQERGMPDALFALGFVDLTHFWEPWCIALAGGDAGDEVAAIAFSACLGDSAAETGVTAIPAFRGRGFAAAATAGWASHAALRRLALFYSTTETNVSSQRVAQRLGLRFLGTRLSIR